MPSHLDVWVWAPWHCLNALKDVGVPCVLFRAQNWSRARERESIYSEVKERNKNVKLIRLSKRYLIDLILVLSTRLSRGDLQLWDDWIYSSIFEVVKFFCAFVPPNTARNKRKRFSPISFLLLLDGRVSFRSKVGVNLRLTLAVTLSP